MSGDVRWAVTDTPQGAFFVAQTADGVWRATLGGSEEDWLARRDLAGAVCDSTALAPVLAWVDAYFAGRIAPFTGALDLRDRTPFQRAVLLAVAAIPAGETRTYGAIARQLGRPAAGRAVGAANAANPLPLIIPCHRLVGRDGSLRGYGGGAGIATKRWLLDFEGAPRGGSPDRT